MSQTATFPHTPNVLPAPSQVLVDTALFIWLQARRAAGETVLVAHAKDLLKVCIDQTGAETFIADPEDQSKDLLKALAKAKRLTHACALLGGSSWFLTNIDPLEGAQAVTWPKDVIQQEPSCTSGFQSYTASAAAYAVSLVSETVLSLIDGDVQESSIRSWVRGQEFLDNHYPGLELREWAHKAADLDGVLLSRSWK